tara:strand:+ start:275 stop:1129 length:855 start_codon:yes stop_codon:yes gene_type:complete
MPYQATTDRLNTLQNRSKSYTVKVKLPYFLPAPKNSGFDHRWIPRMDEEGAFWEKIIVADNRADAVNRILRWAHSARNKSRNGVKNVFNHLDATQVKGFDEFIEVSDDYNEVFLADGFKVSDAKFRLLTKDKIEQLIEEGRGEIEANTRYPKKRGSVVCTKLKMNNRKRTEYQKVEGVPYLFVRTSGPNMNRYFANVPVRRNITKGTKVKVISIEREPNGNIISRKLDVTKGKKVQNGYNKKVLLNSRNVVQAAKEARKLVEENEKVVPKRRSGFTKEHHQNTN